MVFRYGKCVVPLYFHRQRSVKGPVNPLNAELNPICHLLAFLGAHHILHISRIGVNRFLLSTTAIYIVTQHIK